jgi:hypothetical protein
MASKVERGDPFGFQLSAVGFQPEISLGNAE